MSMALPTYIVDAFTSKPFAGNPAGVCLSLEGALDDATQRTIAAELRHSETAFVTSHHDFSPSNPIFGLRWFTPTTEVNLCGHATLATAHVIFHEAKLVTGDEVHFSTKSGILTVRRKELDLTLDFPRGFPMEVDIDTRIMEEVLQAFELPIEALHNKAFCATTKKLIVELKKPSQVLAAKVPNPEQLTGIAYPVDVRGIALTTSSAEPGWKEEEKLEGLLGCDFMTRYFSPWNGIPEDPVNGSSHTILPYYYTEKLGKTSMRSWAASPRGGYLTVSIPSDSKSRVYISGNACTVLSGTLKV